MHQAENYLDFLKWGGGCFWVSEVDDFFPKNLPQRVT